MRIFPRLTTVENRDPVPKTRAYTNSLTSDSGVLRTPSTSVCYSEDSELHISFGTIDEKMTVEHGVVPSPVAKYSDYVRSNLQRPSTAAEGAIVQDIGSAASIIRSPEPNYGAHGMSHLLPRPLLTNSSIAPPPTRPRPLQHRRRFPQPLNELTHE
jgi:hypothetical protein